VGQTIAERVAEAASRTFVGRRVELGFLRDAIAGDELPFHVAFVHGPGGIGKSRLVQALLASLDPDTRGVHLDCRNLEPTPRGFQTGMARALGFSPEDSSLDLVAEWLTRDARRTVVALDTYEVFGLLDAWLRTTFLPMLPASVVTVIAGRERPHASWRTAPGWAGLVEDIALSALNHSDAMQMLRARGLSELQAARANSFARGHPLALELVAAAFQDEPETGLAAFAVDGVPEELIDAFLARLPANTIATIEAASISRRITEPILRALLGRADVRDEFDALRRLPFVERTAEGLLLHDVVRDTVARDLAVRDPEAYAGFRRRASRFFTEQARGPRVDLWQATADLIYLIKNPLLRDACFPSGGTDHSVEPATPADESAIRAIADRHETPTAAALLLRWWDRHPETFAVARDPAGKVAALVQVAQIDAIDPEILDEDPIAATWCRHLRGCPPRPGHCVLAMRRWLGRESGEGPSAPVGACWLDVKRVYMQLRPNLSRLYSSIVDLAAQAPVFVPLGFAPAGDPVRVDGVDHHPVWLDFGPGSVDGWLSRLIDAEVEAEAAALTTRIEPTGDALTVREIEVLRLLADGLSNRAIGSRLVISEKTANRHVSNIFAKLGVHSRAQAARLAAERGITAPHQG
jgi:DNA-binding CsgD family transcriptional regulator